MIHETSWGETWVRCFSGSQTMPDGTPKVKGARLLALLLL